MTVQLPDGVKRFMLPVMKHFYLAITNFFLHAKVLAIKYNELTLGYRVSLVFDSILYNSP